MERVILHADANSFYASVELLGRPELKTQPVAVCGDPEARHGIVLAKNQPARAMGVATGEPIWQARRKCPGLVALPPHFDQYMRYSRLLRDIYAQYTDRVEPYGLDEAWLDISAPGVTVAAGERLADMIRLRSRAELGITVSVGVSFGKVMAKLASDMKKPDGTTVLKRDDFQAKAWPLPAEALLYVGGSTLAQLTQLNIRTIGDLARSDEAALTLKLGKHGAMLKAFALGLDAGEVAEDGAHIPPRSVGHSVTLPKDVETPEQARCVLYQLAEAVCARMREQHLAAGCVSIALRAPDLSWRSRQMPLLPESCLTGEVAAAAMRLFEAGASPLPLRSMGLTCSRLTPARGALQLDFLGESERRARAMRLEDALDALKARHGHRAVRRGVELWDRRLSADPLKERDEMIPFHAV
ncbi:MAG: DNA polymerase IV [Christensenellaceae bacterium]|nr:DNA polymerase IV [Christensenellaceae bacterium]